MTPPPKGAPPASPFSNKAAPAVRPSSIALEFGPQGSNQGSRPISARTPPIIPPTPPPGAAPAPNMAPPPPPPRLAKTKAMSAVAAMSMMKGSGKPPALPPLQRTVPKNVPQPLPSPKGLAKGNLPPPPPPAI